MTVVGSDPVLMLTGPIPGTASVLHKSGLSLDDIDLFESMKPSPQSSSPAEGARRPDGAKPMSSVAHLLSPSARRDRRAADDHMIHHLGRAGGRYGLQNHVRRRRHGQRNDHRATVVGCP